MDASIFEFFQDCDREMDDHGSLACGCCFVVILVSVIVVFAEVF